MVFFGFLLGRERSLAAPQNTGSSRNVWEIGTLPRNLESLPLSIPMNPARVRKGRFDSESLGCGVVGKPRHNKRLLVLRVEVGGVSGEWSCPYCPDGTCPPPSGGE